MNSIQKEREAFGAHIKSTYPMGEQLAKNCGKTLCELYSSEWEAWQAAKVESHKQAALHQFEINHLAQANQQWCEKATKAQVVPDGFVVVPEEPTERMLDSAYSSISDNLHYADLENIYKAMIWSAQEQSHD